MKLEVRGNTANVNPQQSFTKVACLITKHKNHEKMLGTKYKSKCHKKMHHSSGLRARKPALGGIWVLCHANLEVTDIFSIPKMKKKQYT
jgi:hypothetical protein